MDAALARTKAIASDVLTRLGFRVHRRGVATRPSESVRIVGQGDSLLGAPVGSRVYLIGDYWNRPDWPAQKKLIAEARLETTRIAHHSQFA